MRTALVGIDGSGKTTVARRLRGRDDLAVLHAVRAHHDPDSPHATLSRHLTRASTEADAAGCAALKVAVFHLQLSLYGPAERAAAGRPVLADRHPLIDPLVYLPLYAGLAGDAGEGGAVTRRWWCELGPITRKAVKDRLHACTGGADVWGHGAELLRLGRKSPPDLLGTLRDMLGVGLPETIVLLDLPVDEALERTHRRASGTELHEQSRVLAAARDGYQRVLGWLSDSNPGLAVHRVDCLGRSVDEVTAAVARLLRS